MGKITENIYDIKYYEIDYRGRVILTSIFNYLCDVCMTQSSDVGMGLQYLKEQGKAWVIYKWDIDIKKYPLYKEKIKVITEAYSFRKFYAYRKFKILNQAGEEIITASSVWFYIDVDKRKPTRVQEEMFKAYEIPLDKNDPLDIEKIQPLSKVDSEKVFNVRYSDIDTNLHVNNAKYAAWMVESVPLDIVLNYQLKNIKITYEKETKYGEVIRANTEIIRESEEKLVCLHKIIDKDDKELTLGKTVWEKLKSN